MKPEQLLERVTTLEVVQKALVSRSDDHEARLRYAERVITLGFGGVAVIQLILPYAQKWLATGH